METKKTEKDVTKSYKKLWKNAEYILDLAKKAEPELWSFAKSLNQDEMTMSHFIDFFLNENTGKFCHQIPIPEFEDWIVTSIDDMNGESLPYSRKIFPHEIIINDTKFKKHELFEINRYQKCDYLGFGGFLWPKLNLGEKKSMSKNI